MAVTIGGTNITFNGGDKLGSRTHPDYAGSYNTGVIYHSGPNGIITFTSGGATYQMMSSYLCIRLS